MIFLQNPYMTGLAVLFLDISIDLFTNTIFNYDIQYALSFGLITAAGLMVATDLKRKSSNIYIVKFLSIFFIPIVLVSFISLLASGQPFLLVPALTVFGFYLLLFFISFFFFKLGQYVALK